jgi:hypothetical protein
MTCYLKAVAMERPGSPGLRPIQSTVPQLEAHDPGALTAAAAMARVPPGGTRWIPGRRTMTGPEPAVADLTGRAATKEECRCTKDCWSR